MSRLIVFYFILLLTAAKNPCFINRTEADPLLPSPPAIKVSGKTFVLETSFPASWYKAEQFCRLHRMNLASIDNQEENNKLGQAIAEFGLNDFKFWTSGNDLDRKSSYVWQSTGSIVSFTAWKKSQPDHYLYDNETEHCVEIDNNSDIGGWNDCLCSSLLYFICEY